MITDIPKNARELIRVQLREFEGRRFIDVRKHYKAEDGEIRPTREGVTIAPEKAEALAAAIRAAAQGEGAGDG
ncbi:MAG: transcriptional coactivator p15/PC4 family protein [Roseovarius sp.]|uniref:transcriptional coactivator p15/PC4 family protein n=1 Tax=Roseovarius sp. TaxID=1486281 RepID=UPI00405A28B9